MKITNNAVFTIGSKIMLVLMMALVTLAPLQAQARTVHHRHHHHRHHHHHVTHHR